MDDDDQQYSIAEIEHPVLRFHPALLLGSLASLASNVSEACSDFWEDLSTIAVAHANHVTQQRNFHVGAALDIETITGD